MGIVKKLFGARQPAPLCEIHPDDRDLVRPEDLDWWKHFSLDECKAFEQEDITFRFAAWTKFRERDELSDADAARKVRLTFPRYYSTLTQRSDEKFALGAEDAKLPYVLRKRITDAVMARIIKHDAISRASSANALLRELIRA